MSASLFADLTAGDWVDLGCAVFAALCVAVGGWRGLSGELALGTSWAVGLLGGWYGYRPLYALAGRVPALAAHPAWGRAAAAVAAVLLVWIVARLVRLLLGRALKGIARTAPDHTLGALFGLARALVLILVATAALLLTPWPAFRRTVCERSRAGRVMCPVARDLLVTASTMFPNFQFERAPDPGQPIVEEIEGDAAVRRRMTRPPPPPPRR
jgi:membrane protein required for colicin V production